MAAKRRLWLVCVATLAMLGALTPVGASLPSLDPAPTSLETPTSALLAGLLEDSPPVVEPVASAPPSSLRAALRLTLDRVQAKNRVRGSQRGSGSHPGETLRLSEAASGGYLASWSATAEGVRVGPSQYQFAGYNPFDVRDPYGLNSGRSDGYAPPVSDRQAILDSNRARDERIADLSGRLAKLRFEIEIRKGLLGVEEQNKREVLGEYLRSLEFPEDDVTAVMTGILGPAGVCPGSIGQIHCRLAEGAGFARAGEWVVGTTAMAFITSGSMLGLVGESPLTLLTARDRIILRNRARSIALRAKYGPRIGPRVKYIEGRIYGLKPSKGGGRRWFRMNNAPVRSTGVQNHHLISNPIVDALEQIGVRRETALALRDNPALQKMSAPGGHIGYQHWHRAYDDYMVDYIMRKGRGFRVRDFFDEITRYYSSGEPAARIPGVNLGSP